MNDHQQFMRLRVSRVAIIVTVLGAVLGLTAVFLNVAESAFTAIVVPAEYIDKSSTGHSNGNLVVANSVLTSDDFNSCTLDSGLWTLVDPVGDATLSLNGTQALLSVPAGVNHDVWTQGNRAPRLMQATADTDFEVEVKFESTLNTAFQLQGVLVEADAGNFLRIEFHSDNSNTRIFAAKFVNGAPTVFVNTVIGGTGIAPLYMRVTRVGNLWTLAYSLDGANWTVAVDGYPHTLAVTGVGVYVGNAGGALPAHTGIIDYFFNTDSPIIPEDAYENTLTVNVSGSGSVTRIPDSTTYACGEVVELTAVADPNWTFGNWSGDATGTENPIEVTMDSRKVVTATFTREEYTLTVDTVGEGQVVLDPPAGPYFLGEVVTLTAVADPGWTFSEWSGDASGNNNPDTVVIAGNTAVTATFTQDQYALDLSIVGNGQVTVDPDQATYLYGEVVTLTATADTGWTFSEWSGDVTGSDNPVQVTMDGDKSVTATFTQDQYALDLNIVGNGLVTADPDQATYLYGEVVTLTATADPGWTFSEWSGDASGSSNPEQVTMDGDKLVTATFTQDQYTLDVNIVGNGQVSVDPDQATYLYGDVVTLTATADTDWAFIAWSGDATGTSSPVQVTMDDDKLVTATFEQALFRTYMPLVSNNATPGSPDLVVHELLVSNSDVQVVILNQGSGPVSDDFWVDVYINPDPPPSAVNQIWPMLAEEGLVWGITGVTLNPGQSLTLTIGGLYYFESESNFSGFIPNSTPVYAQVDSLNTETDYGAVLESHEIVGGPYNNISSPVFPSSSDLPLMAVPDSSHQTRALELPRRP